MKLPDFVRSCALAAAVVLGSAAHDANAAAPWPEAPYGYFANNARLDSVLADFASSFSLSLAMQPDVTGTVNGRFSTASPTEFLTKLAGIYGFVWYTHAGTLFVSRASDVVTRGIAAPGGNVGNMRKALADLGVLEPRFGWGELADHGVAMISGPPSYVNLIEGTIRSLPARAQQLQVFRLQHASADDRTIQYRDKEIKTPGLASILKTMIAAGGVGVSGEPGGSTQQSASGVGAPLRPAASVSDTQAPAMGSPQAAAPSAAQAPAQAGGSRGGGRNSNNGPAPMVQAEPRLNAVIIQDVPERMPLYQQLIAQLDVPTALVEIEAMIIDISTERAKDLGVNWSGRVGKTSLGFGGDTGLTATFTSNATAAGNFLIAQLQALESKGEATIQSRPSVLTSDNMAALLDLAETFYIRTQGERVATVTPVTAGTTLKVSPHVVEQGGRTFVQLKIDIEDGQITDQRVDSLPTVSRSAVSTEATVLQGESLLIAGYTSNRDVTSRKQVPVLGDIPAVGALFASDNKQVQRRERMFLIRPKVVSLMGAGR